MASIAGNENDARAQTQKGVTDSFREADFLNACGTKYQNQGMFTKAISLYRKSLKCLSTHEKSNFNLATCLCELGNNQDIGNDKIKKAFYAKALKHYGLVIHKFESDAGSLSGEKGDGAMPSSTGEVVARETNIKAKQLVDLYTSSLLNAAALKMKFDDLKDAQKCILKILNFCQDQPKYPPVQDHTLKEARYSLNSLLRRLGKKNDAILACRDKVNDDIMQTENYVEKVEVRSIDIGAYSCEHTKNSSTSGTSNIEELAVVCVKWGTKYGMDYLNNLYAAVKRNLSIPHKFYCLTDDVVSLSKMSSVVSDRQIIGVKLEASRQWTGWWNKAQMFSGWFHAQLDENTKRVLYIDLDTVITGSLDRIVGTYHGPFAILSTKGLDNEGQDFSDGYNSSIMMWRTSMSKDFHEIIYKPLLLHMTSVHKFIYRFDHWLEMVLDEADLLQDLYPHAILEYRHDCKNGHLPRNGLGCIVNFPLKPKPHEVVDSDSWVAEHWVATE